MPSSCITGNTHLNQNTSLSCVFLRIFSCPLLESHETYKRPGTTLTPSSVLGSGSVEKMSHIYCMHHLERTTQFFLLIYQPMGFVQEHSHHLILKISYFSLRLACTGVSNQILQSLLTVENCCKSLV